MRLVSYRKQGRNVFYHLQDSHVLNLYRSVAEHLDEEAQANVVVVFSHPIPDPNPLIMLMVVAAESWAMGS